MAFAEIDVSTWQALRPEVAGSKPDKLWLAAPNDEERWLFKPVTSHSHQGILMPKGEDWAEKIATEIARNLGLPVAEVELANRFGVLGVISRNIAEQRHLVLGNEVLAGHNTSYPMTQTKDVPGYTFDEVSAALRARPVVAPPGPPDDLDVTDIFAGYLVFDAIVGNTDRHHENWGVLASDEEHDPDALAPTFDHASSLGFQLHDDDRGRMLNTDDPRSGVEAYASKGRSRHFEGSPLLTELALHALANCSKAGRAYFAERIEQITRDSLDAIVAGIPETRMSEPSRIFSIRLLLANQERMMSANPGSF